MYPNGGFAQRPREHEQVISPVCSSFSSRIYSCLNLSLQENQPNDMFAYAPPGFEPDPNQAAFPNVPAHPAPPVLDQQAGAGDSENLRRLASRYVRHPASQVYMIQMEPGFAAGRYKVVIVLDMADFP